jgi:pilus assembly protein CpaE
MSDRLRIYAVGTCEGLPEILETLAHHDGLELVGASATVADAAGALTGGHLDVVLQATTGPAFPADMLAGIREHSRAAVILLASGDCSGLLEEALEAGIADVLPLPQLTENVVFAIRKVSHVGRRLQGGERQGRVITVFSPKGGTGKTVISSNMASCLARKHNLRTLLLDLDLQFGDAAIMLGLEPEKTIYDLVVAPGELDPEKLAGYTTRHACGLDVLPAPLRPEDAELVTEAKLARLLEVASHSYDAIVVDTSPFFHGPMLATLDRTNDLLLICGMDVPTVKNVRLGLQTLELLSFPPDRIKVVLNRANSNVGIKRTEIERALETKIRFDLPSDRAVPLGVNRGNPVILGAEGSDFAKALRHIANELLASEGPQQRRPAQQKRRLFSRAKA